MGQYGSLTTIIQQWMVVHIPTASLASRLKRLNWWAPSLATHRAPWAPPATAISARGHGTFAEVRNLELGGGRAVLMELSAWKL